ncbi:MAG TPA: hypothetical protein ENJ18_17145 [Nannocystis exedens]|nr:hypothetical protein [Nannocystis exedens]
MGPLLRALPRSMSDAVGASSRTPMRLSDGSREAKSKSNSPRVAFAAVVRDLFMLQTTLTSLLMRDLRAIKSLSSSDQHAAPESAGASVTFADLEIRGPTDALAARQHAVDLFARHGLCWFGDGIDRGLLERCRSAAEERLNRCLGEVQRRALPAIERGTSNGYAEIVARAPGRYDMLYGTDRAPFDGPSLRCGAKWMPLVDELLGGEATLLFSGLLMTLGGADRQPWHTDGEHLFGPEIATLPPHVLNVFVPLVDICPEIGGTELCPGSHHLTRGVPEIYEQSTEHLRTIGWRGSPLALEIPAGSVLLFDYRLLHRALANRTDRLRPIFYLTFARPWFRDVHNFPDRRLFL